jgi:hypothetical protein
MCSRVASRRCGGAIMSAVPNRSRHAPAAGRTSPTALNALPQDMLDGLLMDLEGVESALCLLFGPGLRWEHVDLEARVRR